MYHSPSSVFMRSKTLSVAGQQYKSSRQDICSRMLECMPHILSSSQLKLANQECTFIRTQLYATVNLPSNDYKIKNIHVLVHSFRPFCICGIVYVQKPEHKTHLHGLLRWKGTISIIATDLHDLYADVLSGNHIMVNPQLTDAALHVLLAQFSSPESSTFPLVILTMCRTVRWYI